ncbi:MAG: hypothetical protein QOE90_368 [Thermoplasmata archaeon]|nr:hypothetical protein [Thermoplasmata archaeon]
MLCPNDRGHGRMQPALIEMDYPRGKMPAEGMRCPVCGEEAFWAEQVHHARRLAERLGLYGPTRSSKRKLHRSGTSVVVSLDPTLLREALGGAQPGDEVEVSQQGDAVVIRRASG